MSTSEMFTLQARIHEELDGIEWFNGSDNENIFIMPTIPDMPNIPSFPTMPKMPSMSNTTSFPSMPKMPSMPTMPRMPALPNMTDLPRIPNIPNLKIFENSLEMQNKLKAYLKDAFKAPTNYFLSKKMMMKENKAKQTAITEIANSKPSSKISKDLWLAYNYVKSYFD